MAARTPAPAGPPPAGGQPASLRAYYVAVGSAGAKLPTLVELLEALRADARLAVAVACSARDSVDAVAAALANCGGYNIAILHSDMEMHDMEQQVLQLKRRLQPPPPPQQQQHAAAAELQDQATAAAAAAAAAEGGNYMPGHQQQHQQQRQAAVLHSSTTMGLRDNRSLVLICSDVCLRALPRELLPLGLSLLIQFDVTTSKDVLQRRLSCVFGSSKERGRRTGRLVTIDFAVAGELPAFRARERLSSTPVLEMPVHVPDVFV